MFEQIESYQPITITIQASYLQVFSLMTTPFLNVFSPRSRENMTFSLCFTAISNHIQHIKFLLFHDPHFQQQIQSRELFPFNPHDVHTQNIKRKQRNLSLDFLLPFYLRTHVCL